MGETYAKAMPEGSKKTIESFASFLSKEQGRNVCLKRYQADSVVPSGAANPIDAKVCYISGVRSKRR